jgi:hypothetical protein
MDRPPRISEKEEGEMKKHILDKRTSLGGRPLAVVDNPRVLVVWRSKDPGET